MNWLSMFDAAVSLMRGISNPFKSVYTIVANIMHNQRQLNTAFGAHTHRSTRVEKAASNHHDVLWNLPKQVFP